MPADNNNLILSKSKPVKWWLHSLIYLASSLVALAWQAASFNEMILQGAGLEITIASFLGGWILHILLYQMGAPEALMEMSRGIRSVFTGKFFSTPETDIDPAQPEQIRTLAGWKNIFAKLKLALHQGFIIFGLAFMTAVMLTCFTAYGMQSFHWMSPSLYGLTICAFFLIQISLFYSVLSKISEWTQAGIKMLRQRGFRVIFTRAGLIKSFIFTLGTILIIDALYASLLTYINGFNLITAQVFGIQFPVSLAITLGVATLICGVAFHCEALIGMMNSTTTHSTQSGTPRTQPVRTYSGRLKLWSLGFMTVGCIALNAIGKAYIASSGSRLIPGLSDQVIMGVLAFLVMSYVIKSTYEKLKSGESLFPQNRNERNKMWIANGLGMTFLAGLCSVSTAHEIGGGLMTKLSIPGAILLIMTIIYLIDRKCITLNADTDTHSDAGSAIAPDHNPKNATQPRTNSKTFEPKIDSLVRVSQVHQAGLVGSAVKVELPDDQVPSP